MKPDLLVPSRLVDCYVTRPDGIVKSMLEHSRGVTSERRKVDLNNLVEEALNLAYYGARNGRCAASQSVARLGCSPVQTAVASAPLRCSR
jgi:hypothetical protein